MAPPTTFPDHVLLFLVSVPQRTSHNYPSKNGCLPSPVFVSSQYFPHWK